MKKVLGVVGALSVLIGPLSWMAWLAGVFFVAAKLADNGVSTWLAICAGFGIMVVVAIVVSVVLSILVAIVEDVSGPPVEKHQGNGMVWNGSAWALADDPDLATDRTATEPEGN